jgi:hypothetical protein
MSNATHYSNSRRLAITVAASALIGLGAIATAAQAAPGI